MMTPEQVPAVRTQSGAIRDAVDTACGRIAPTWPLDQLIAVNPYWGFISDEIQIAASRIGSYSGSRMVMPRSFYRARWHSGAFTEEHLQAATERSGLNISTKELLRNLENEPRTAPPIPLLTSIVDSQRDLLHGMSVSNFVTHNVSQHCAAYFDRHQSTWQAQHGESLYQSWLAHASADLSPRLLMGLPQFRIYARTLPNEPLTLIEECLRKLPVPQNEWEHYLTALLMSINGWASWCAYERWQARLSKGDDDSIVELLAIRLAWEGYAFVHLLGSKEPSAWKQAWHRLSEWREQPEKQISVDWLYQDALETAYQYSLCRVLTCDDANSRLSTQQSPAVQAVFCIDVRSEALRRALENCSDSIQTLGFAGFFGLPISYTPLGTSDERSQLPGLLSPKLKVSESTGSEDLDHETTQARRWNLRFKSIWQDFRASSSSTFTFVESCGFLYASSLLKNTLCALNPTTELGRSDSGKGAHLRPCILHTRSSDVSDEMVCDLVSGILKNMSLTSNFARLVLLTGHGSQSMNNPHAAGLECGACGGHNGEVNARLLAQLLNNQAIRFGLLSHGIDIPTTTCFLAALHNTTTDEIRIFDTDLLPQSHASDLACLQQLLRQAGQRVRRERAELFNITVGEAPSSNDLLHSFQARSRDWSQVRPEWGLANNAAFIVAPRSRSRGIDLQGRAFLHEYEPALDPDGSVLEAIMTAPMLVTNWINMQYYASTVDNRLYGSGNKVLHNVVGGRIGVFEGNGGDLRIGLPMQSLHDGHTLRHTPLRLSVFIQAPRNMISRVLEKHEVVRNLVRNSWLHLFQIDESSNAIFRYTKRGWRIETAGEPEGWEQQAVLAEATNG